MKTLLILTVGHNASGKTTVAKKLSESLDISLIDGDDLRVFLKQKIRFFQDLDFTHPNPKAKIASGIVHRWRLETAEALLKSGQSVIYCSSSPTKEMRQNIRKTLKQRVPNITTVILYAKINEEELLGRLQERDKKDIGSLGWEKHYRNIKKAIFEEPDPEECDHLLIYDQTNYEQLESELKALCFH